MPSGRLGDAWYRLAPAGVFLAILPLTHTVALRLACLSAVLAFGLYARVREGAPAVPFKPAILAWAGIALASLAWSVDREYSRGEVANEVGYAMAAFAGFYWLSRSAGEARVLLRALVAGAFCVAVLAIATFFTHMDWVTGASVGVGDRNAWSTYVVLVAPVLLLAIDRRSLAVAPPWALWSTFAVVLFSGALTLNRTMWPALGVAVVVWLALRPSARGGKRLAGAGTIAALAAVLALAAAQFAATNLMRHQRLAESAPNATEFLVQDPRVQIWQFAIERAKERPLQGHGFGRGILRQQFRDALGNKLAWHAHNVFLGYAIAVGIPGLIAFVWLLASVGRAHWRLVRSGEPDARALGAFGLSLLAAMILRGMADDVIVRDASLLFWSLTGIALGLGTRLARAGATAP